MPVPVVALALFLMIGCGPSGTGDRASTAQRDRAASNASADEPPLCDPAVRAIEDGTLEAGSSGATDARATGRIALRRERSCARLRVAFLADDTSGAPARNAGVMRAEVLRSLGIVRLPLDPTIGSVTQPDTTIEGGDPIRAVYVVRAQDQSLRIDVHLASPALLRGRALDAPARWILDAEPGGGAVPAPAAVARNVVVLEPRPGAAAYPLVIRGYARTFEANVVARLRRAGSVVAESHTTAADYMTTWGEFEITLPRGPGGRLELFVGENDAESGAERGVRIPVVMP